MEQRIGVGIIGCGSISGNHITAIGQAENVYVAAVCDIDPAALERAAQATGAAAYADYRDLLADERVQAVHICTPHYLHAPMAIAALQAGKHVLVEKPMATNLPDALRMAEVAKVSGKQLGICFQNRYNASTRMIRTLLDSGELGAVLGGHALVMWDRGARYYASGAWRGKWATEGGATMINQAIHTLDLLRDFAGDIVDVKTSMSAKRNADAIEAEDTCDLLLTGANGGRFLFYATNCAVGNWPIQLCLRCEQGDIEMNGSIVRVARKDGGVTVEDFSDSAIYGKDYWGKGHLMLISDFYRCIRAGETFPINGEEALKTTRLLERIYTDHVPDVARK